MDSWSWIVLKTLCCEHVSTEADGLAAVDGERLHWRQWDGPGVCWWEHWKCFTLESQRYFITLLAGHNDHYQWALLTSELCLHEGSHEPTGEVEHSGVREQFWPDALSDAVNDSDGCTSESNTKTLL